MLSIRILATFNGTNGAAPRYPVLAADAAGDLFGTTSIGGLYNAGTVFEIVKTSTGYASAVTTLASFTGANGADPAGGLIIDGVGNLFGTTTALGANNLGNLFEIPNTTTGYSSTPIILASFGATTGSNPYGALIADNLGNLFSTTSGGGAYGYGTVFEFVNSGANGIASTIKTVASFNGANGAYPRDGLLMDANGDLFGTTSQGGLADDGTVFEITRSAMGYSSPITLVSFNGSNSSPEGSLVADAAGDLFGTTVEGGSGFGGTVFELVKTGTGFAATPTILLNFSYLTGPDYPFAGLTIDAAGDLFGTGTGADRQRLGAVFELRHTANGYASTADTLLTFNGTNGLDPIAGVYLTPGGDVIGVTNSGGPANDGVIYDISQFVPMDFDNDGSSDLVLQNTSGAIAVETQAGLGITGLASLGNPGPNWHVVASADLNGDRHPDILVQDDAGDLVAFVIKGTLIAGGYNLGNPGSTWHVRGTGVLNGDGIADILLQDDNGDMVLFGTNGTNLVNNAYLGTLPAGWAIEGVGDFYGSGQPDILVQSNTGALVLYIMTGTTVTGTAAIGSPVPGFTVAGLGDFNGDGKADILLHNDNGADVIYTMNGATGLSAVSIGNPGPDYSTAITGDDLNGDGTTDLVLRSASSGTLVGFNVNNATITAGAVLTAPGPAWNVLGGNPTTFIDGTGATLGLTGTAGPDQFVLTSYAAGIHTITNFDPATDTIALNASAFPNYARVQMNEAAYMGGTFVNLSPTSALVIQNVLPGQLNASNFVLR